MDQSFMDSISDTIGEELAAAALSKVPAVTCTVEDELTEDDLRRYVERAGNLPATKSDEKDVATIRARHQQVARLLALNMPESVVALMSGYTAAYLSTLKNSPSMIELIAHYKMPGDNATKMIAEKLRLVADMSLEQLMSKLEAGEVDVNQLLAAIKLGADRSNNGPMAKVDHLHTHILDEEQAKKLAESSRRVNAGRIIDITAVRQSLPSPTRQDDAGKDE